MTSVCVRSRKTCLYLKRPATRPPSAGVRHGALYGMLEKVQKEEVYLGSGGRKSVESMLDYTVLSRDEVLQIDAGT